MRTVALQTGLDELKALLDQKGFKTVDIGQTNAPLYAFIYYEALNNNAYNTFNHSLNNSFQPTSGQENTGILMINAKGKQPEEILDILLHRTYSPLF